MHMAWEIKHRYTGDVINSGEGDLRGADLRGAYLRGADLGGADLRGADLRGAYLRGADLGGADLRGTCVIDIGQRSDGYQFFLQLRDDDEPLVLAGCRYMPLSEARQHWLDTRAETQLGDESQALLDHGERLIEIRKAHS
jgi:uncharacterized protein YjbI with pentapeptide repeats